MTEVESLLKLKEKELSNMNSSLNATLSIKEKEILFLHIKWY